MGVLDLSTQARRVALDDRKDAVGIGLLGAIPIPGRDGAVGVALDLVGDDTGLDPEHMLAGGRPRGIEGRGLADDEGGLGRQQTRGRLLIGARHHLVVRGEVHIGEAPEFGACRPVGKVREREVQHHRAGAGAEISNGLGKRFRTRRLAEKLVGENLRVDVRDDGAAGREARAVIELDGAGAAVFLNDPGDGAAEMDFAAQRGEVAGHRLDDGVGAALADDHAEILVGHGFEIGKHGAAGDVGAEIEMEAPGCHQGAHFGAFEIGV